MKLVNGNLKSEVERVQNDIIELAQSNYDELQPKFEKTEQVIKKIDKLKLKINELKSELDQQVYNFLIFYFGTLGLIKK